MLCHRRVLQQVVLDLQFLFALLNWHFLEGRGGEEGLEGEVVVLRDRVILVVMTSGAGKGKPQERFPGNVRGVGQAVVLESLRPLDTVGRNRIDGPNGVKARRIPSRVRRLVLGIQDISRYLLLDEGGERLVLVHRSDDVIPVAGRVRKEIIPSISGAVGIPRHVEPVAPIAFTVMRGCQEVFDQVGPIGFLDEFFDALRIGRQSQQVEMSPAQEGVGISLLRGCASYFF